MADKQRYKTSLYLLVPLAICLSAEAQTGERHVGIKTNMATWAAGMPNASAEVQIGRFLSLELPVIWCPWYLASRHAAKNITLQPECRRWLRQPGEGHFIGIHAHVSWFNVKWRQDRYQDARHPLWGAGISYGYLLPLHARWAGEFTLGGGYARIQYDTFYNIRNGARIETRGRNYWGITRIGISIVYRLKS